MGEKLLLTLMGTLAGSVVTLLVKHILDSRARSEDRVERAREKLLDERLRDLRALYRFVWSRSLLLTSAEAGTQNGTPMSREQTQSHLKQEVLREFIQLDQLLFPAELRRGVSEWLITVTEVGVDGLTEPLRARLWAAELQIYESCYRITGARYLFAGTLADPAVLPRTKPDLLARIVDEIRNEISPSSDQVLDDNRNP